MAHHVNTRHCDDRITKKDDIVLHVQMCAYSQSLHLQTALPARHRVRICGLNHNKQTEITRRHDYQTYLQLQQSPQRLHKCRYCVNECTSLQTPEYTVLCHLYLKLYKFAKKLTE